MFTKTKSYDENTEIIKGNPTLKELEKIVVKVNDCYVPENYGRPIVQHHVNVLAAIFDFKKVGEITISKIPNQNGKLYEICDGNHRHQAMQKKYGNDFQFKASLLPDGLSEKQRAEEYKIRNKNVQPMKPVDLFRADWVMEDKKTHEIVDICNKTGTQIIGFSGKTKSYPNIASIRDLNDLHHVGNLEKVIKILRKSFDGSPKSVNKKETTSSMLRCLNRFLVFFEKDKLFKEEKLIDTLKKYDTITWVGMITQSAQFSSEGVGVLKDEYNRGLKQNYRLENPNIYIK